MAIIMNIICLCVTLNMNYEVAKMPLGELMSIKNRIYKDVGIDTVPYTWNELKTDIATIFNLQWNYTYFTKDLFYKEEALTPRIQQLKTFYDNEIIKPCNGDETSFEFKFKKIKFSLNEQPVNYD